MWVCGVCVCAWQAKWFMCVCAPGCRRYGLEAILPREPHVPRWSHNGLKATIPTSHQLGEHHCTMRTPWGIRTGTKALGIRGGTSRGPLSPHTSGPRSGKQGSMESTRDSNQSNTEPCLPTGGAPDARQGALRHHHRCARFTEAPLGIPTFNFECPINLL